ncbi:glycosyltransferase family 2 protein [Novosphingobium marinum]|uniref:Glycosyltransferase involved in cell wall biosynthesis n=1 Tax=Novosphingobium marinum TaxID=1514948 RepID=A0A7Z0BX35_9SPHN|nr:glycosyltransferase family 2 protein [Novosphingobium marinum]NYH97025.1 glycosyltransferase involved in cell wall biosynthesis [Novosphingobium marinum]
MTGRPQVSVVVPCFNGEKFLRATLQSVLRQTEAPLEIIVADNGSTDESRRVAFETDPSVVVLDVPERGASIARIAGAKFARGDAIMFLDADDLIAPDTLAAMVDVLQDKPGSIARCPWRRYVPASEGWRVMPASCPPHPGGVDDLTAWLSGWYHPPCSILWSRSAYHSSGGWDPDISVNDDGDIVMRALVAGVRLVRSDLGTGYYRRLPEDMESLSSKQNTHGGVLSRIRVLEKIAADLASKHDLDQYRHALNLAVDSVLSDARNFSDLLQRCIRLKEALSDELVGADVPSHAKPHADVDAEAVQHAPPQSKDFTRPSVSVIIPTYNRASIVGRAIESVLGQDHANFELLVVDDCSTDDTLDMLEKVRDPRMRILRQPRNAGVAAARNRGMREARGELIAFLDSDDEWLQGKLSAQVRLMAGRPEIGLTYTGVEHFLPGGVVSIDLPGHRGWLFETLLVRNVVHGAGSNAMIRRDVVETIGYFDEKYPAIEDYDFWVRLARFFAIDAVDAPLIRYYDDTDGAETGAVRRSRHFERNMKARRMFYDRFRMDMRRAGVETDFLLDSIRRHLESPDGDAAAAASLGAKALKAKPREWRAIAWPAACLLPRSARLGVRAAYRVAFKALARRPETRGLGAH